MASIETIGVMTKPAVRQAGEVVPGLLKFLGERGIKVRYDEQTAVYLDRSDGSPRAQVPDGAQLVIVLGGDGTLLSAARAVVGRNIPLMPVNLGGLGFLTAITAEELYVELDRVFAGDYRVGLRSMLHCELWRDGGMAAQYEALNDVVVTKAALARMIDLDTYVGANFVCTYKADGLIVATPTGSTAYSLSAGGPIVFPTVTAFCISPICPHMLTNRPVVVPDDSEIRIINKAEDANAFLTIDGQVGGPLFKLDQVVCRRSEQTIQLVRPPKMMFFDVLREKLSWGQR
ncbi:MAG: NAD(+)/NADH kinase [Acidobacteria bacterium]|nr:NAD(+)/NADH kinase [Acidobacteriota bacterium]MBI3278298.1 NAD(+)/NADH kinase [Acidobacteriota bacterium]